MLFKNFYFDKDHPLYYKPINHKLSDDLYVVEIGYNRVPKGYKQTMNRDVYILHYVVDGGGKLLGSRFDSDRGYLIVPNELEIIEADSEQPYESYWIMFKGSGAKRILSLCGLEHHNSVFPFSAGKECAQIIRKALFDLDTANYSEEAALLQAAFYQILALHLKDSSAADSGSESPARQIRRFINNNYYQKIEFTALARRFGYTRNYISTLFKNKYGISPSDYLANLRIEKAKELLTDSTENLSVGQIALAVGFSDALYFSRLFSKKTGVSPSKYRQIEAKR